MAYTLVSVQYIPPDNNMKIMPANVFRRVPTKKVAIGKGYLVVFGNKETAKFEFYFRDEEGVNYCFDAYPIVSKCMITRNLTYNRQKRIIENVKKLANYSDIYEPEEWFETTVKSLKI